MTVEHLDVLIVGAGLSGIGAGYHLQRAFPKKRYAILEARSTMGGTWDLFRYPGIRSDSDMFTLGYSFRPWKGAKAIADGPSILTYIEETARDHGIDRKIRYGHRVDKASWSTETSRWTVEARVGDGAPVTLTCDFLLLCTGYYDYANGYMPEFPGVERFGKERVVHPQLWRDDIDYTGKRVVVIGSGATAVTLVPELAKKAAIVTMLQRSPTYIVSLPSVDPVAKWLRKKLPEGVAYDVTRIKNVSLAMAIFNASRAFPAKMKELFVKQVKARVGETVDVEAHFTPTYNPWDQRLCLVPDADLFKALRVGAAEMVTDHIDTFTEKGIQLKSGRHLDADLVVSATGLKLQFAGGMKLVVDGREVDIGKTWNYKGTMLSDVPNFAVTLGYTNASWTLKADLVSEYVCRLLQHMDENGYKQCVPRVKERGEEVPLIDFSSGYVQRAIAHMPKQGPAAPWRLRQNYFVDLVGLRFGTIDDGVIEFSRGSAAKTKAKKRRFLRGAFESLRGR